MSLSYPAINCVDAEPARFYFLLHRKYPRLRCDLDRAVRSQLQRLHGDHKNPRHVAGVDHRLRADLSDSVVAEGRIEVLRHWTIVAKLFRIVANEVPKIGGLTVS
jgi:hypothetical protein